jgi:transcription elongation factor GreA
MLKKPITPEGYKKLEEELKLLKSQRGGVIEELARCRAFGDLSENAEYDAIREKYAMLQTKIADVESKLASSEIVDLSKIRNNGRVVFGARVHLRDLDTGKTFTYQIVGEYESDINNGKISVESPVARALINKEKGEIVTIRIPAGELTLEILDVELKGE